MGEERHVTQTPRDPWQGGHQGLYHPVEPQTTQPLLSTGESHPTSPPSPAPALSACPWCPHGSEEQEQTPKFSHPLQMAVGQGH